MVLKRIRALLQRKPRIDPPEPAAAPPGTRSSPTAPVAPRTDVPAIHRGPDVVHHPVALQDLDADAVRIVKRLTRFDYTAYLVGGCVRDLLLDLKPKDFDIATSATPRQVKRLFSNCRIIGRRFRLAHVFFQNGKIIEVATFRARDGGDAAAELEGEPAIVSEADEASDLLIRDDNVFGSPEEDALRRDFTINALFYDVNAATVIDHADGLGDLRRKLVRTIGDPVVRFREDPIRILRAIKFAARLGFAIEPRTLAALRQTRAEIPKAATPRILEEFNRFCRSGTGRRAFELAFDTEVFEVILPELAPIYEAAPARRALFALLDAIDARWVAGREISPGDIFSALIFAAAAPGFGFSLDGGPTPSKDVRDARLQVDDLLRPIALRLRIARKDQEHVRQTLATLHRMVPFRPMKRGARFALMRRPAFETARAVLDALAPVLQGEFAAARAAWQESIDRKGADGDHAEHAVSVPTPESASGAAPRAGRRRRGRRGGRGRRRTGDGLPPVEPIAAAAVETPRPPRERPAARDQAPSKLPPVWDDGYFFAALPSVPQEGVIEAGDSDRYAAGIVEVTGAAPPENPSPAKRRRRRGGRRHRKSRPILPADGSPAPSEGDASS